MISNSSDEFFMSRCLQLARKGKGKVAPNPMVGSVIVYKGKIIGEGYHRKCGEAHAEVNAVNSVEDKKMLQEATIYVTLEPCSHYGKTPPCADLIVSMGIPNVVIGMKDPFAKVNGEGIKRLRNAGCNVKVGVLKQECYELNREFITFHTKKRPYIILKWAQTLDGFIDIDRTTTQAGQPNWITNEVCRALVHKWRSEVKSIMVGTNTVEMDNPSLNVRSWAGDSPLRIFIDKRLRLSKTLSLYDKRYKTLVLNEVKSETDGLNEYLKMDFSSRFLEDLMKELYDRGVSSLFVEGGATLLQSFIDKGVWDEARVFIGNTTFRGGVSAPIISGEVEDNILIDDNRLIIYDNFIKL